MAKKITSYILFLKSSKGFSLMEVLIAITIFSLFVSVFVTGQGFNLVDSTNMKEEIKIQSLANNKMNEILANLPLRSRDLRPGRLFPKETKSFENDPDYSYTIEWAELEIPDLSKIVFNNPGNPDNSGDNQGTNSQENALQRRIVTKIGQELQKLVWQLKVEAKNKETGQAYELSTWIYKEGARVDFSSF